MLDTHRLALLRQILRSEKRQQVYSCCHDGDENDYDGAEDDEEDADDEEGDKESGEEYAGEYAATAAEDEEAEEEHTKASIDLNPGSMFNVHSIVVLCLQDAHPNQLITLILTVQFAY